MNYFLQISNPAIDRHQLLGKKYDIERSGRKHTLSRLKKRMGDKCTHRMTKAVRLKSLVQTD